MNKPLTRAEVPVEATWNLDDLFPSQQAWSAELDAVAAAVETVTRHKGRLGTGAATLMACLDARDALLARVHRVIAHAHLRQAADGSNAECQATMARAATVHAQISAALAF